MGIANTLTHEYEYLTQAIEACRSHHGVKVAVVARSSKMFKHLVAVLGGRAPVLQARYFGLDIRDCAETLLIGRHWRTENQTYKIDNIYRYHFANGSELWLCRTCMTRSLYETDRFDYVYKLSKRQPDNHISAWESHLLDGGKLICFGDNGKSEHVAEQLYDFTIDDIELFEFI